MRLLGVFYMRARSLRPRNGQTGFTLTELLVVIGVIALLIGILLPTLGRARESSRKAACMAHLKTLGECLHIYAQVWKDRLPNLNPAGPTPALDSWDDYDGQNQAMVNFNAEFVKSPGTFFCPSDTSAPPTKIVTADWLLEDSARVSYEFFSLWFPAHAPARLSRMKGRAPLAWDQDGGEPVDPVTQKPIKKNTSPLRNHKGGGNVLISDGHVEWEDQKFWEGESWPSPAASFYADGASVPIINH
jgi:prepilin-type N-terminal cleavage/methylation domain-containing protein